jgi:hypothetical protein
MVEKSEFKSPVDFADNEDWRDYVKATVAPEELDYTLAFGRTTLFLRFFEMREQPFPAEFRHELDRLQRLSDPERTQALEALNGRILARISQFLMEAAPSNTETVIEESSREEVQRLLDYIGRTNPAFVLWMAYNGRPSRESAAFSWEEYVFQMFGATSGNEVEFTLLMSQLGRLLYQYRDSNRALPHLYFQRIWFLHYYRTADRNLQTRALVQGLLEEIDSCTFA